MIWLAAIALLITAATVWFVARPLARAVVADNRERFQQLPQLRERLLAQLRELDVEEADRNVDATVVSDERRRLEAELAQVLREMEGLESAPEKPAQPAPSRRGWAMTLLVLGIVLPLAAGLYMFNQRATLAFLSNPETQTAGSVPPMALEMVARLESRLKEQPDDAAGWARLGRAYAVMGKVEQATAAYARAYKLTPDDPRVIAEFAAFLYNGDPQNTGGPVYALYSRLLKLDPQNPDALWFLGFAAYQRGDDPQALGHWNRLLKLMPPDSNEANQLRAIIAKVQEKSAKK